MSRIYAALILVFFAPLGAAHEGFNFGGPDGHAPIGVMGDHVHDTGELMFAYRYMRMEMDGNLDGTDELGEAEVLNDFVVSPIEITTEMHMFGMMYALNDRLTLVAMAPYVEKEMDHVTRMGAFFTTESDGVGDVKVGGLYSFIDRPGQSLHLNLGLSLPTGSINEKDDNPACTAAGTCPVRLPYPMQIGTGTFDPTVGLTWRGATGVWSWGAQGLYTARLGRNENGYSQGESLQLTAWGAWRLADWISLSARLAGSDRGNYDGEDDFLETLPDNMIPTARPDLRGGQRIDVGVGVNLYAPAGVLRGHRLALEYLEPVHQDLDGPQLQADGMFLLGWQYTPPGIGG